MAQITFQYLGTIQINKNETYTASQFATLFAGADVFILKSKTAVNVSINKTPPTEIKKNDFTFYDGITALSYVFDRDCLIAIGKLR